MGNIEIQRVYAKNFRFEINETTMEGITSAFNAWSPHMELQVNPRFKAKKSGRYELVLAMQLTLYYQTKPLVHIYFEQAGLFTLPPTTADQRQRSLYGVCANHLFPYAGAVVNTLLAQAALPPVYIAPQDFVVLYERYEAEQAKSKKTETFTISSSYNEKTLH